MTHFLQFFFFPVSAPWYTGTVWGNLLASVLWELPLVVVLYRKKYECSVKWCWRLGHYGVDKTHYKTCIRHTTPEDHGDLVHAHLKKYPKEHAFLFTSNGQAKSR